MRLGLRFLCGHAVFLLAFFLLSPAAVFAQLFDDANPPSAPRGSLDVAEVRVDGYVLFRVRGVAAFPAERRAKQIAYRIEAIASDAAIQPESLRLDTSKQDRVTFKFDDEFVFSLVDADAELEGIPLYMLAEVVGDRVKESVVAYRQDRSFGVVVRNVAYAVLLTLVFAVVLFGLSKLFRWFDQLAEGRLKKQIETLEKKSLKLVQARQVWGVMRQALTVLRYVIIAFAVYVYLNSVLRLFPVTREIGNLLLEFVVNPLTSVVEGFIGFIPSLTFLVILVFLTRYILRSIRALFGAIHRESIRFENFEPEWAWPTYRLVRVAVIVFALVIAYPYIPGSDSGAFKGISLFLGVLFSIGSTSIIANVIAGYSMTYRRAFRIGDRVRIGDTVGEVMEMRLLVTHVRTAKNEEVVIPNSVILNGNVVNYSSLAAENGLILHTCVGIGYEVPWRQVEAMLVMAAQRTAGLLDKPKPFVLQTSLGDFAVNYELNAYCSEANHIPQMYSELHRNIQDVFNEYGVQIMTPSYEADPPQPKLVTKEHWYDSPAVAPKVERT